MVSGDGSVHDRMKWHIDSESPSGGTCIFTDCRRCFETQGGLSHIGTICPFFFFNCQYCGHVSSCMNEYYINFALKGYSLYLAVV